MVTHIFPLSRVQEAFQLRNHQVDAHCGKEGAKLPVDVPGAAEAIHVLIDCQRKDSEITVIAPGTHAAHAHASPSTCC
jgi:hypothetical protein